jgi:hypothetical protein
MILTKDHFMSLSQEAESLSRKTGLKASACKRWMQEESIRGVPDLHIKWPELSHAECIGKAQDEIERFILFKD